MKKRDDKPGTEREREGERAGNKCLAARKNVIAFLTRRWRKKILPTICRKLLFREKKDSNRNNYPNLLVRSIVKAKLREKRGRKTDRSRIIKTSPDISGHATPEAFPLSLFLQRDDRTRGQNCNPSEEQATMARYNVSTNDN